MLVRTEAGKTRDVASGVRQAKAERARIISVEAITGPYDLIVALGGDDLDAIAAGVTASIQSISGVKRTITNLVVNL